MNITRQINNRKIGKSPSQLGEQSIPIYGDKATYNIALSLCLLNQPFGFNSIVAVSMPTFRQYNH